MNPYHDDDKAWQKEEPAALEAGQGSVIDEAV